MSLAQDFWSTHAHKLPKGSFSINGDGPAWLNFVPEGVRGLVKSHLPPTMGAASPTAAATPQGASFLSKSFSNYAGTRP